MIEVELSGPEQARNQQAADGAFRVLTGHEDDYPPAGARVMAEFSLPNADPQVGQLPRRFFAFAIAALAAAIFISLYFGGVASQFFEQADDKSIPLGKTAETATAELQQELQKNPALTRELATARRDFETMAELSRNAANETAQLRKTAEGVTAELQQERQKTAALMHSLDGVQPAIEAPTAPDRIAKGQTVQAKPIAAPAAEQPPTSRTKVDPEAARLMARANGLLGQGNISGARIVLERAIEMGSAGASFAIAETYDPRVLSGWKAYGTRGDAAKAREFYAKAAAGGIEEARDRLESLR
jgi:hypothetical protein